MELWDLYDENRQKVGTDHVRGWEIPEGRFHLVVHVWIRNHRGEYLLSQRSANRPSFPLMWECTGGSVCKGEDSLTGALREVREELGLTLRPGDGRLVCSSVRNLVGGVRFADILDVWLFSYSGPVDLGRAETDEVARAGWMTRDRIRRLYDAGQLVYTLGYFFEEKCFEE